MNVQSVKQRFGIIGNTPKLNRALEVALQVAPTDISVLISGESGTGKEIMPQIIHQFSTRKHSQYIAVNCGAIPEGTIDSELFGHEKGAFTGAHESRKGYFEVADKGTIFLDEVSELPLETQVRLLRVLETGEFIKVGSSKVLKTDVRIIAAANVDLKQSIQKGKFRDDLYYRLSTIPIELNPLRERQEDIHLLFRKFASDFAEKYRMPTLQLEPEAIQLLENYRWPGNIRQLKNIAEQISIIENERKLTAEKLGQYLPAISSSNLPMVVGEGSSSSSSSNDFTERELLYKVLFDMKKDISEMKKFILQMAKSQAEGAAFSSDQNAFLQKINHDIEIEGAEVTAYENQLSVPAQVSYTPPYTESRAVEHVIEEEESLSLEDKEKEMINKALKRHKGKRKYAAQDLGISERTLYRKIKEYDIDA